jgi:hypothetical protein
MTLRPQRSPAPCCGTRNQAAQLRQAAAAVGAAFQCPLQGGQPFARRAAAVRSGGCGWPGPVTLKQVHTWRPRRLHRHRRLGAPAAAAGGRRPGLAARPAAAVPIQASARVSPASTKRLQLGGVAAAHQAHARCWPFFCVGIAQGVGPGRPSRPRCAAAVRRAAPRRRLRETARRLRRHQPPPWRPALQRAHSWQSRNAPSAA